jgi:hypothetical protein
LNENLVTIKIIKALIIEVTDQGIPTLRFCVSLTLVIINIRTIHLQRGAWFFTEKECSIAGTLHELESLNDVRLESTPTFTNGDSCRLGLPKFSSVQFSALFAELRTELLPFFLN